MADITAQVTCVYHGGDCNRAALLAVKNANAGDTFDTSQWFRVVKKAGLVSDTGNTIAAVPFTGTVCTVPTGPAADGVWVILTGVAV